MQERCPRTIFEARAGIAANIRGLADMPNRHLAVAQAFFKIWGVEQFLEECPVSTDDVDKYIELYEAVMQNSIAFAGTMTCLRLYRKLLTDPTEGSLQFRRLFFLIAFTFALLDMFPEESNR